MLAVVALLAGFLYPLVVSGLAAWIGGLRRGLFDDSWDGIVWLYGGWLLFSSGLLVFPAVNWPRLRNALSSGVVGALSTIGAFSGIWIGHRLWRGYWANPFGWRFEKCVVVCLSLSIGYGLLGVCAWAVARRSCNRQSRVRQM